MSQTNKDIINDALQKIEAALQITLEEESDENEAPNTYKSYHHRRINNLTLSNISFDNFDALEPVFKMVNRLKFINCTINDISALVNIQYVNHLTLDGVKLNDVYKTDRQIADTISNHFQSVELINMTIEHVSILLPLSKQLRYLDLTKCTISNFYELNLLPNLYSLSLTEISINQSPKEELYKANPNRRLIFLNFKDMQIKDLDPYLSVFQKIEYVDIDNCRLTNLQVVHQFPQLKKLTIDALTVVENTEIPTNEVISSFQLEECIIDQTEIEEEEESNLKTIFNIQKLASIAPTIKKISFKNDQLNNTDFLQHFTQLETLKFEKCEIDLNDFKSVAHQIRRIFLDECRLKNYKSLQYFTQLENIEIIDGYDKNGNEIKTLENLKRLLPLKNQLKKLRLWESDVKELELIEEFLALESLELYEVSGKTAERIFSLPNLKRLSIDIADPEEQSYNIKDIKNIEWLVLQCDNKVTLKGLHHLNRLERLEIESGPCDIVSLHDLKNLKHFTSKGDFNINKVATIETLQTLELDINEDYEINGLQQFPNLENLSIQGGHSKIKLGKIEKLKVLDMEGGGSDDTISFLNKLPNLEKLNIGYKGLEVIPDLSKLQQLKMLSLAENSHIKNIEGLKHLQSLEDLNLFCNEISDIRVLNNLPNLKEVNIAGNPITQQEAKNQLDKPEIAVFYSLPRVPFIIWRSDYFQL